MDYIAILFLIFGLVFIIFGLLSTGKPETKQEDENPINFPPLPRNKYNENEVNTMFSFREALENKNLSLETKDKNPIFLKKEGYLYLDHQNKNLYNGEKDNFFQIKDVMNIKRVGSGVLMFDGITFFFQHSLGRELFDINRLNHIAFYPNCLAFVSKDHLPSALIFVDETKSLKNIIEKFKVSNNTNNAE